MSQTPSSAPATPEKSSSSVGAGMIASIVGLVAAALFMLQNMAQVPISFLFWTFTWPLWLYGLVMALIGGLVALGLTFMRRRARRKARRDKR